jgi:DNA segregation ATPase FtsK/SpoIIIE-like protein
VALVIRFKMARRPKLGENTKLRIIENRIWLDDYRLPRGELFWTTEQADFVFERLANHENLSPVREQYLKGDLGDLKPLEFALGFDSEKLVRRSFVDDAPHAILIGTTGSGKTQLLKSILEQLTSTNRELQLVCIDFKGGAGLGRFENQSIAFASDHDMHEAARVIDAIETELRKRELGQKPLTPMVIAIDELAHLLTKVKRAGEVLASVAARGRSAHMHLILTNQNLVGVSRALLSNIGLRVLIGHADPVDATMLGQQSRSTAKPEPGYASGQVLGHGQAPVAFSFALVREPKQARERLAREPQQHQRSKADQREYSNQGRGRHRLRRQPSIRGLLSRAHMAESR